MRCSPFVCILALVALTTHKGGNDGGRSSGTVVHARTSTPPPFGEGRPSSGGAHIGPGQQQRQSKRHRCTRPNFHAPRKTWRRPSYKATCAKRTEAAAAKGRDTVMHARTSTPRHCQGRPSYKATCTNGSKQHEARGGREMRLGVMDREALGGQQLAQLWRHCQNTPRGYSPGA